MCGKLARSFAVVLLIVIMVLAAIGFAKCARVVLGGARRPLPAKSPHIVVDTLNLVHWLHSESPQPLSTALIVEAIDDTAAVLKKKHSGRVMYVLKDRESALNSEAAHKSYMECAKRNQVYIFIAEKYATPPRGNLRSTAHSASGRDDFLIAVLARRWRCAALTEDKLRDFSEFRSTLQPFHVYDFAYWRDHASREYFRPESVAYAGLKKPRTVQFAEYF